VIQAFADEKKTQPLPVTAPEVWEALNREVLQRNFAHASGVTMPVMVMTIDTGSRPKPVYAFAQKHARLAYSPAGLRVAAPRTVVPVKGNDDALMVISKVSKEDAARKRQGVRIVGIGTHCVKQELYDLLRDVKPRADGAAEPYCYHFPMAYEKEYFFGLCSEKRIQRENDISWERRGNSRNEPLDLKVYNRGAAAIFGIDRFTPAQWRHLEAAVAVEAGEPQEDQSPKPVQEAPVASTAIRRRGFIISPPNRG
jgi:phage terminase large subunit GpA-like protein